MYRLELGPEDVSIPIREVHVLISEGVTCICTGFNGVGT